MAYRNTLPADALELVAQKLQSSLAVEGDLPKDGLAAYGDRRGHPAYAQMDERHGDGVVCE